MNDTNSEPRVENSDDAQNGRFKIDVDPKIGETIQGGIQTGVEALGQFLSGFVKSIQDSLGPDLVRNMSASQWLAQVAASLDEVATAWQAGQPTPSGKLGELSCYLERLDEEIAHSRVESQKDALRERLSQAMAAVESEQVQAQSMLSNAAGYFRAAAKSAMPAPANPS